MTPLKVPVSSLLPQSPPSSIHCTERLYFSIKVLTASPSIEFLSIWSSLKLKYPTSSLKDIFNCWSCLEQISFGYFFILFHESSKLSSIFCFGQIILNVSLNGKVDWVILYWHIYLIIWNECQREIFIVFQNTISRLCSTEYDGKFRISIEDFGDSFNDKL